MADQAGGFLGRWAKRKNDALQGKPLTEPAVSRPESPPRSPASAPVTDAAPDHVESPVDDPVLGPTLDDALKLTTDSDFKPFMAQNVGPEVRNAAMKKLFSDPQFNVMDGLDIYIDDYSKPDPIPESMLRQMVGAQFLNLFGDEKDQAASEPSQNVADNRVGHPDAENAAAEPDQQQLGSRPVEAAGALDLQRTPLVPDLPDTSTARRLPPSFSQTESLADPIASQKKHVHTDLRLQPDDAAAGGNAREIAQ